MNRTTPAIPLAEPTVRTVLRSDELTCPSCIQKIEHRLGRVPGVAHSRVHFATGRIEVDHDPKVVTPAELAAAISKLGYRATPSPF
jgi:copper chaperone